MVRDSYTHKQFLSNPNNNIRQKLLLSTVNKNPSVEDRIANDDFNENQINSFAKNNDQTNQKQISKLIKRNNEYSGHLDDRPLKKIKLCNYSIDDQSSYEDQHQDILILGRGDINHPMN